MSLFYYCIEVWGSALQKKYLNRIYKFFRRAYRYGYTTKSIKISEVIEERDRKLFRKIVSNPEHALHELLPVCKQMILRQREHNFILPQIKTERFGINSAHIYFKEIARKQDFKNRSKSIAERRQLNECSNFGDPKEKRNEHPLFSTERKYGVVTLENKSSVVAPRRG
jgi:hypothetical protein